MQLGAPLDLVDSHGNSALVWASGEGGNESVVRALIDGGADVNLGRSTALMEACLYGHEAIARLLLDRGARQELQDRYGKTALYDMVQFRRLRIVELLCSAPGAAAALVMQDQHRLLTPLALALMEERNDAIMLLCAVPGAEAALVLRDYWGRTPILQAVEYDDSFILEILCATPGAAAALVLQDNDGRTPLALAIASGHAACAAVLRARGAPE